MISEGGHSFLVTINKLPFHCKTNNAEATFNIGASFSNLLTRGDVVFLSGPMGSGKTQFVRGVCSALKIEHLWEVDSPTYTLINHYQTQPDIHHLDLHRLQSAEDLGSLDLDIVFQSRSIKLIEWPNVLLDSEWSDADFLVKIQPLDEQERSLSIYSLAKEAV